MARAGETELLERGGELEAIDAALSSAAEGAGRSLLVSGPAGLGKSRLLDESRALADERGLAVLSARGDELERDFSFGAVLQLFGPALQAADGDELLAGAARLSEPLFTGAEMPAAGSGGEFPLLHGLHWLAANAAERSPLLIVVDDAHWADAPSLRWLHYLLQRLDELPIAMIAAARPDEGGPQEKLVRRIGSHRLTETEALRPLSEEGVAALVRAAVPEADDELCRDCAVATGGNPFYVSDFIVAIAGERGPGATASREDATVSGAVLARIERLGEPASSLARAVAVLGDEAPLDRAAALSETSLDDAARGADALASAAILEPGVPLRFVHALVREAVYSSLPAAGRSLAHARAAELLREEGADPEQAASHLVEAGGAAGDWSAAALREAAGRASERGAPAAAARYLEAAVKDGLPESERGAVLAALALAEAQARLGDPPARAREALAAIADPSQRGAAALEIGMALVDHSNPAAVDVFAQGLEGLDGGSDDDELAMTLRSAKVAVGIIHATADPGDLEGIVERAERGVATPAERLVLAHGALAPSLRGEAIEEVRRLARAALAGPPPDVTSPTAIGAHSFGSTALFMTGLYSEAESALDAAVDRAREEGAVLAFGTLSHVRAHSLHRRGRLEEAIADFQSALDTVRYGWEPELPALHAVLALCLVERGELAAAEGALDVPGGEERWGPSFTWADYLDARGRLRLARGDAQGALDDFIACGERLVPLGTSHSGVVPWRPGAVAALVALGETERAGELANEELELARGFGAKRELGDALRCAGIVAGGDRGVALLREAVATLRESEAELELARALCDLGRALLEENHRLAAREALTEALDLAHRCRADALEETARERLVATGARPRRASARGSDALTPRERRIATMAADGLGNREIAEALFITTKTVETHLGRAYRKLEISSRRELPDALAEEG